MGLPPSIWPVRVVTSGFGPRVSPFTEKPAWYDGLDIGAQANSPVQAPALGRVVTVAFDSKMGNMVKLDHGYGIETVYGHLAKSLVKEGQRVKRGDVVARREHRPVDGSAPSLYGEEERSGPRSDEVHSGLNAKFSQPLLRLGAFVSPAVSSLPWLSFLFAAHTVSLE